MAEGINPRALTREVRVTLERYAAAIAQAPLNLVGSRDRHDVWERHVRDALGVVGVLRPEPSERWIDVGSGGGFPGAVLGIVTGCATTLCDARQKKMAYLSTVLADLGLDHVEVLWGRAESLAWSPQLRGRFQGATIRAVAPLVPSVELCRGFVAPGGRIAVIRGRDGRDAAHELRPLLSRLGVEQVTAVGIPTAVRETWLVTMQACGPPPDEFPRPEGVPVHQPLGSTKD